MKASRAISRLPRNSQSAIGDRRSAIGNLFSPLAERLRNAVKTLRTIIGVPDYERYVEHVRQCHPDRAPMTRDEFARERLEAKYSRPGQRCC